MSTDYVNPRTCPFCGEIVGELPDHLETECPEAPRTIE